MKRLSYGLFAVLLAILPLAGLFAQDRGASLQQAAGLDSAVGKQWAVFIAINRYKEWPPLNNPVRDAKEIRDILNENFYIDEVRELYDDQATAAGIRQLFVNLRSQTGKDDSVFVFYAGHGYKDTYTNTGSWIPADGGLNEMAQTNWLPNIQIRSMLSQLPAKHVFLISDSCYSGDIMDLYRGPPPQISGDNYKRAYSRVSRQIMTSGASESVPDASEFAMRLKDGLRRAEGVCIDPGYLYYTAGVREVKQTEPLLGMISGSGHQDGGSFLFFKKQASQPKTPTPQQPTVTSGSVTVNSEIAGEIYIDGQATGRRIKAGGTETISNVSTGYTEVAVKDGSGATVRAPTVMVRQGQTATAVIERPIPDNFVRIQSGTFTMGSPANEADRRDDEAQHRVTVNSFYMGKYEVTQKEYQEIMGTNPSSFKGDNLPVEMVSWYDAAEYCNKRSQKEGLIPAYSISGTGDSRTVAWNRNANGYRLPTEAEWEYACRAGTATPFSTGNNVTTSQANYNGNYPYNNNAKGTYREKTTAVGSFAPNAWGLYDMHGNVLEWCWDWYGAYGSGAQIDPAGASSGFFRVRRGGSWYGYGRNLRSADRYYDTPSYRSSYLGFRLVRP